MDDDTGGVGTASGGRFTRRRLIALAGTGLLGGLAGCSGGGSDGATDSPTPEPTPAPGAEPTPTGSQAADPTTTASTQTATPTDSGTPTPALDDLPDEYRCAELDADPDLVVSADGDGDYETVGAAIDAVPDASVEGTQIYVEAGRYREKLSVPRRKVNVTLVGADPAETVITYDDHAEKTDDQGRPLGTGGSASVAVGGRDFTASGITFENAAEPVAQAVAVRVDADRALFHDCRFLGNQDTLYTNAPTRQYYRDCYVEGDVDFVFGAATAYFRGCELFCKEDGGYVTAAATPRTADYGYVFDDCEVTADGAADDSYYLGRPWGPYAQTVFMNSWLGDHVHPAGWHNWGDPANEETAGYAEYGNEGPGYAPDERVEWADQLSDFIAGRHGDVTEVFGGWNPEACL